MENFKSNSWNFASNYKCYGCREIGHVKFYRQNQSEEKKDNKFKKKKNKVFYDSSSSSDSSNLDVEANLCLIANNESSCNKVSNSSIFLLSQMIMVNYFMLFKRVVCLIWKIKLCT